MSETAGGIFYSHCTGHQCLWYVFVVVAVSWWLEDT